MKSWELRDGHGVDAAHGGTLETRRGEEAETDDVASVVISEVGRRPACDRAARASLILSMVRSKAAWDGDGVCGRQVSRELEEIKSVDVVVDGLLEVEAIGTDLSFGLLQDDFPAAALPAGRIGNLRARHADGEERYAFAQ